MTPGELHFETLKTCQYSVADYGKPECESDCAEPASHRCTWDGGLTWLYLCPEHARKVEAAEEAAEPVEETL